jgi:DNA-directed RNA polymerase alpha subunit
LPGIQETVLDILCNLQNVVFKKNLKLKKATILNSQTAYLRRRGPGVITVADIILPEGIQCVNPDQYIATLTEDGVLNMKIFINEGQNAIKQKQKNRSENMKNVTAISDFGSAIRSNYKTNQKLANKIYLDSVFMPVTKVNTIIQNNNKCTDDIFEKNMLFKKRVDSKPDYTLNDFTSTNTSGINLNTASTYKNSFFLAAQADTVPASNDSTQEPFITLSEINKKQQNKQCHIIIEIWTNGSIHPREALYDCLGFLSKTFGTLENIKMLGSMFKSDLIYSQILNKNTKKLNPDIFNKKFMF